MLARSALLKNGGASLRAYRKRRVAGSPLDLQPARPLRAQVRVCIAATATFWLPQ